MSNMCNPNKFIKMIGGQEQGRKRKILKAPAGQPGLRSPRSLIEDQALIVLVHGMGPNWESVNDAIGSTSQFENNKRKRKPDDQTHDKEHNNDEEYNLEEEIDIHSDDMSKRSKVEKKKLAHGPRTCSRANISSAIKDATGKDTTRKDAIRKEQKKSGYTCSLYLVLKHW